MLKLIGETETSFQVEKHMNDVVTYHIVEKAEVKEWFQVVNRPLHEEEMKHGDWVWDSFTDEYIKLDFMFDGKLLTYHRMDFPYRQDFMFEEGRYYRYQPLESEV